METRRSIINHKESEYNSYEQIWQAETAELDVSFTIWTKQNNKSFGIFISGYVRGNYCMHDDQPFSLSRTNAIPLKVKS